MPTAGRHWRIRKFLHGCTLAHYFVVSKLNFVDSNNPVGNSIVHIPQIPRPKRTPHRRDIPMRYQLRYNLYFRTLFEAMLIILSTNLRDRTNLIYHLQSPVKFSWSHASCSGGNAHSPRTHSASYASVSFGPAKKYQRKPKALVRTQHQRVPKLRWAVALSPA